MQTEDKKKVLLIALSKVVKELRGKKSQFMFSSENDFSTSIISTIERGIKDPQLTTVFKLSEAFEISPVKLMELIINELPKDFSLIEK